MTSGPIAVTAAGVRNGWAIRFRDGGARAVHGTDDRRRWSGTTMKRIRLYRFVAEVTTPCR
jgi:hypothetical protein